MFKDETSLEIRRYADEFLRSKKASKAEEIDSQIKSNNKRFLYSIRRKILKVYLININYINHLRLENLEQKMGEVSERRMHEYQQVKHFISCFI